MSSKKPKFIDSPFLAGEPGKRYLKPGAPEDIQKEFKEFMEGDEAEDVVQPTLSKEDLDRLK